MSSFKRRNRPRQDLHFLNEDGMVACNPRDREAAHRAENEGIATHDIRAVTCRKCLPSARASLRGEGFAPPSGGSNAVRIRLTPYDPDWPRMFSGLADRIHHALSEKVLLLEHVGSTAVPGLSAKPMIDLVLAVADSSDEPAFVPPLEAAGFVFHRREPDWYQHRLLKPPGVEGNLHVFSRGCEEIERMLVFRDRLRADEGDRKLYVNTKQDLAGRLWASVQEYADAKSAVIREILNRAEHV